MKKPPTIEELRDRAEARAYSHANTLHSSPNNPWQARYVFDFGRLGVLLIEWRQLSWSRTWMPGIIKLQDEN